jgi:hypothetical protein
MSEELKLKVVETLPKDTGGGHQETDKDFQSTAG